MSAAAVLELDDELLDLFDVNREPPVGYGLDDDEIIIDCFAGGGGASLGIEMATGRSPDEAINHSKPALAIHQANHPRTNHHHSDIWEVDPVDVARGRRVGILWLSPDCTHFSRAKGGKPVSKKIRILAHVAIRYAKAVRPRMIFLENVEEFLGWGPISRKTGKPDPLQKGKSFRAFVRQLRRLRYVVEWKLLRGQDFGSPTSRRRLFLIARCDGLPIIWPRAHHGPNREQPYRVAAECIDFSLPCPSIFLTKEEAKALGLRVKRPIVNNTNRRIARGMMKYVINTDDPFIVPTSDGLTAPTLIQVGYGERKGQAPRTLDIREPLGTVVAGGNKHALVTAFLAKHYGGHETPGTSLTVPMDTITATDHHALVASTLIQFNRNCDGRSLRDPLPTITAQANKFAEVRAFLVAYYGNEKDGASLKEPMRTVTAKDRFALVTVHGIEYAIADIGMRTLTARELANAQGFPPTYVLATRVEVTDKNGRTKLKLVTETEQKEMVGNSVNPQVARDIIAANIGRHAAARATAA